jgi:Glyoxalase-like domain
MPVTLAQIVVDAADALRLAQFYAQVLERDVDPDGSAYFASVGRSGSARLHPALMFVQVPEARAGKNRVHVDLISPDRAADIQRAIKAGATHVADFAEYGTAWTTLADPEGNVFDIGDGLDADEG